MDTHKKIREHISALKDGELSKADLELAMAALQSADGQQAWNTYHRIGDVLRNQAMPELSDAFIGKLGEQLARVPAPGKRAPRVPVVPARRRGGRAGISAESAGPAPGMLEPEAAAEAIVAKAKPAIVSVS